MGEHRRVILKLSGEALAGETRFGFDEAKVRSVAMEVLPAVREGVELAVVIGGETSGAAAAAGTSTAARRTRSACWPR